MEFRTSILSALHQETGGARRVQHTILRNKQTASDSLPHVRLKSLQRLRIEYFGWNSPFGVVSLFALHFHHFLFVGSNPDRSTLLVLDIKCQFTSQLLPKLLRIAS